MELPKLKLMIPGPVEPEADVLAAMGGPVFPHYGPEWTALYRETTAMLQQIFQTEGDVFLLIGSGSAAVDASIGSALATGEKIIVGVNGFFGERMALIGRAYGLDVVPVTSEWGRPLRTADFADAVRRHPDARAIGVVHLETSTTAVNPIADIGQLARRHDIPYIVDAVSTIGGLDVQMDAWGIDFCASASQKCLAAPPGLAPIAVGPRGWEAIDRVGNPNHGWYLNLAVWREYAEKWGHFHPFPTTMATNTVMALHTSLQNLLQAGIANRLEAYRALALYLRRRLREIGYELFTPDEEMAPVLTAAYGPPGIPTGKIVSFVANEYGIKISGGFGEQLEDKIIRIGHMTPTVTRADLDHLLEALMDAREALADRV